jgi:hypothetical protein
MRVYPAEGSLDRQCVVLRERSLFGAGSMPSRESRALVQFAIWNADLHQFGAMIAPFHHLYRQSTI